MEELVRRCSPILDDIISRFDQPLTLLFLISSTLRSNILGLDYEHEIISKYDAFFLFDSQCYFLMYFLSILLLRCMLKKILFLYICSDSY